MKCPVCAHILVKEEISSYSSYYRGPNVYCCLYGCGDWKIENLGIRV